MSINLRHLAKGKSCQLRLVGICNFDSSTVVLCHIRRGGVAGVGQKPPDLCGLWACSECHAAMDGRRGPFDAPSDTDILEGLNRTLALVSKELGL
jgi:hypothetical protein